ncbi:zinc ribbon domain-containing protein [Mycobacterium camsae]|uniref:zinc ribbon domain-containing protein n=1 Tax=Mycobacterium gordonae TaxID=1778 RepID=UPI003D662F48
MEADRWHPSTRLGPQCGTVNTGMTLVDRLFTCGCGHTADTDTNAARNLAHRGRAHHDPNRSPDPQAGGRATNARRRDGAGHRPPPPWQTPRFATRARAGRHENPPGRFSLLRACAGGLRQNLSA